MKILSLLHPVEQFAGALSLTISAPCPGIDSATGEKSAMSAGADLGGLGALDAVLSAAQGILNPLFSACKWLIPSLLRVRHIIQHTNSPEFWGILNRPSDSFQTGGEGVERAACVPSSISIGAVKIYWHCLVSRTGARVSEVGLTSWDSYRCPIKKKGRRGALRGGW